VIAKLTKYAHLVLFPVHAQALSARTPSAVSLGDVQWKIVVQDFRNS
jgi:hypothetical protein